MAKRFSKRTNLSLSECWSNLRFWWYTRPKGHLIVLSSFSLIVMVLASSIYFAIQAKYTSRDIRCLTLNIYHEARGEPLAGQYAVAEVTMNRVASSRYPDTICGVVFERRWDRIRKRYVGAFSWTEFDMQSSLHPETLQQVRKIAEEVYHGERKPVLNGALFYHAKYIRPSWARKKIVVAKIGSHIFYK